MITTLLSNTWKLCAPKEDFSMLKNFDLLSPSALPISLRAYPLIRHLTPVSTVLRFMQ